MFQGLACNNDFIFGIFSIPKYYLVQFEKAMFQGLAWHLNLFSASGPGHNANWVKSKKRFSVFARYCELIFCLLTSPKCDLDWVGKAMIQVVECHSEVIFCFLTNQKCEFFEVDKATIQVIEWHLKVIFCFLTSIKFAFGEVEKAMFQVVDRHWKLIFSS